MILRRVAAATTGLIYLQIVVGATMRHTGAGLAIPDFPLMFGQLIPPHWDAKIAVHFAHRVGAVVVSLAILATTGHVFYHHRSRRELRRPSLLLLVLLAIQITLGALTVLSGKQFIINSLHVVTGASVLVTSLVLTLRAHRARFAQAPGLKDRTRPTPSMDERRTYVRAGPFGPAKSRRRSRVSTANAAVDRRAVAGTRSRAADFVTLTKPRLNLLVLVTTLGGLYLASPAGVPTALLVHTLLGTALVAGGAAALNQVWERETDRLMRRTSTRPLPQGRLGINEGTWFGVLLSSAGLIELTFGANAAAAAVALVTAASYVLVYTPLKTRTSLATLVGAVPGALPPVIGWAAATGDITLPALVLFGIVFFWQMPHFLAIAWMYRDDYARAGIPLLPVLEPDGRRTGQQALLYAAALWPVSLLPALVGLADAPYSIVATVLGLVFIALAALFARERSIAQARRLFLFSITYLPLLWGALVADRLWI